MAFFGKTLDKLVTTTRIGNAFAGHTHDAITCASTMSAGSLKCIATWLPAPWIHCVESKRLHPGSSRNGSPQSSLVHHHREMGQNRGTRIITYDVYDIADHNCMVFHIFFLLISIRTFFAPSHWDHFTKNRTGFQILQAFTVASKYLFESWLFFILFYSWSVRNCKLAFQNELAEVANHMWIWLALKANSFLSEMTASCSKMCFNFTPPQLLVLLNQTNVIVYDFPFHCMFKKCCAVFSNCQDSTWYCMYKYMVLWCIVSYYMKSYVWMHV